MVFEQATVLAVEPGIAWLSAQQRSACDSCRAQSGCGQAVLSRLMRREGQAVRALLPPELQAWVAAGSEVTVAIPMHTIVLGSLFIYVLPIVGLLLGATLFSMLAVPEPVVALGGLAGLVGGGVLVRYISRLVSSHPSVQPSVVECGDAMVDSVALSIPERST